MSSSFDDMKNCINKNKHVIYSQRWHNLMKTYITSLKVEINARDGSCKY